MPTCAFLTISDRAGWFIDDDLVHPELRNRGWEIEDIPWDQRGVDWNRFDVVVIRSPWDYQQHLDRFLDVLGTIETSDAMLFNPLEIVRWNITKSYLQDLKRRAAPVIPTHFLESPTAQQLQTIACDNAPGRSIIKPLVGANADDTFPFDADSGEKAFTQLAQLFSGRTALVQPFLPAVVTEGEYSVIFFNGTFSHAVLKTVKAGDYRVQEEHGGGVTPIASPDAGLVSTAQSVMRCLPELPLYARVDLVSTEDRRFLVMEVELIEPALYFRFAEDAPRVFADAIVARFNESQECGIATGSGRDPSQTNAGGHRDH